MNIEQIKQATELAKVLEGFETNLAFPIPVGKNVFIRTVTFYYTGQLKVVSNGFLTLEKAAWIADTGRFYDFLKNGKANEVEPLIEDVHIPIGSIIDASIWTHELPREQV